MQHKCNIHTFYEEAAAGWYLPICTYVAFMLHFRAECIFVAFSNYLHFAFLLYFNYLGKTGHANLDILTHRDTSGHSYVCHVSDTSSAAQSPLSTRAGCKDDRS